MSRNRAETAARGIEDITFHDDHRDMESAARDIEAVHFDERYNPTANPLDLPPPPPGIEYAWITRAVANVEDKANWVQSRQRGWVMLDHTELDDPLRYPNNDALVKPGLFAMKRDIRWRIRENEVAAKQAASAMHAVDNSIFNAKERGLVMDRPERSSGRPLIGKQASFQADA